MRVRIFDYHFYNGPEKERWWTRDELGLALNSWLKLDDNNELQFIHPKAAMMELQREKEIQKVATHPKMEETEMRLRKQTGRKL
jgi:hypothetical protein